jgi:hypothetical protein
MRLLGHHGYFFKRKQKKFGKGCNKIQFTYITLTMPITRGKVVLGFDRNVKFHKSNPNGINGPLFAISNIIQFCVGVNMFFS